jgi:hypothetical protein
MRVTSGILTGIFNPEWENRGMGPIAVRFAVAPAGFDGPANSERGMFHES